MLGGIDQGWERINRRIHEHDPGVDSLVGEAPHVWWGGIRGLHRPGLQRPVEPRPRGPLGRIGGERGRPGLPQERRPGSLASRAALPLRGSGTAAPRAVSKSGGRSQGDVEPRDREIRRRTRCRGRRRADPRRASRRAPAHPEPGHPGHRVRLLQRHPRDRRRVAAARALPRRSASGCASATACAPTAGAGYSTRSNAPARAAPRRGLVLRRKGFCGSGTSSRTIAERPDPVTVGPRGIPRGDAMTLTGVGRRIQ